MFHVNFFCDLFFPAVLGICLACSLQCHEKHELVELYTKRNFHCDCGMKSGSSKCLLDPTKQEQVNSENKYNQNFAGLYCRCHRPYPDAENQENDDMIQCVACEDWLHSLRPCGTSNAKSPPSEGYGEMICGNCMTKNDFLADYSGLSVIAVEDENPDDSTLLDVSSLNGSAAATHVDEAPAKKIKLSEDACTRPKLGNSNYIKGTPIFWKSALWRNELCKCAACLKLYKDSGVEFLTDIDDTVQMYEEKGKGNEKPSAYDASMQALSALPRVNQIDAISSYNHMKDKLFEYLQTFVVNNQIVTVDDINRFFRNMKDSKQPQPAQQPHFCR